MSTPKISVIVPAFNAEKYLERCLNSIAAQTMPDFECIIVDDGSTDKTGVIADSYAMKDARFQVIHQSNRGVAVARQRGIDAASGVYTIQFDSDDWVDTNMLDEMLLEAKKTDADLVICDFYRISKDGVFYDLQRPFCLEAWIIFGQILQHSLHGGLWNKLIKRRSYQHQDVRFIPDMTQLEDYYICLRILSHPIKVAYINKALYHYDHTQNEQSLLSKGVPPAALLRPIELIAASVNLSPIQSYYNRAVLFIAYQSLFAPEKDFPNYSDLFRKHLPEIVRAKGFPFHVKLFVLLKIYGIHFPISSIKARLKNSGLI